jgi:hypothetical protein
MRSRRAPDLGRARPKIDAQDREVGTTLLGLPPSISRRIDREPGPSSRELQREVGRGEQGVAAVSGLRPAWADAP